MSSRGLYLLSVTVSLLACTSELLPGRCNKTSDCSAGQICNLDRTPEGNGRCVSLAPPDGGPDAPDGDGSDSKADKQDVSSACTATSCGGSTPICDPASKTCRGCAAAAECSTASPTTPVCDPSGKCVECDASKDCGGATKPVCEASTNTCKACTTNAECAARNAAAAVCDGASGACVECAASMDCKTAGAPICDTTAHACVKCSADAQCMGRDATRPACEPAGSCVGCTDGKKHCSAAAPICDANACRACKKDAECAAGYGADPGLCVNGQCATNDEVIYLQNGNACSPTARGDGSVTTPFCFASDAVAALSSPKSVLLVRGPRPVEPLTPTFGGAVTIVGQDGAGFAVVVGTQPLVSITAGDVTLRDLNISGGPGVGVSATGGILRMTRCTVSNNADAGITTKNAAFDITNTIVAGNMGGLAVSLGTYSGAGPKRFAFNTVVNNVGTGVFCGQTYAVTGLLVNGNGTSFVGMCTTDATTSTATPLFDSVRPYHLTGSSPCVNIAGTTDLPPDDIDGDARPQGPAADCGADEYVP